jgi:hypothetical protein
MLKRKPCMAQLLFEQQPNSAFTRAWSVCNNNLKGYARRNLNNAFCSLKHSLCKTAISKQMQHILSKTRRTRLGLDRAHYFPYARPSFAYGRFTILKTSVGASCAPTCDYSWRARIARARSHAHPRVGGARARTTRHCKCRQPRKQFL